MIKEAYDAAIEVLKKCSTPHGFHAAYPGYNMVFARDAMIISLGASFFPYFKDPIKQSLLTLGKYQSEKGQIPNAVDKFSIRNHHVDFQSIDSSLWFIIGYLNYKKKFNDSTLYDKEKDKIQKAFNWLLHQDIGENGMLAQLPTTDWQDAFPHRYGYTINTQALWYKVLILMNKKQESEKLKLAVNNTSDIRLWDKNYYLSFRWKNHGSFREKSDWFDSLGNLLAIIFSLSDKQQSEKILGYIKKNKINEPYPIKSIFPPITKQSKHWQDYYLDSNSIPYNYLNAGIWTYIGGFYILALIKQKKFKEAEYQLEKLAEANLKYNFSEWLNGKTGREGKTEAGVKSVQGWNAGMYILAYQSLLRKKCLIS